MNEVNKSAKVNYVNVKSYNFTFYINFCNYLKPIIEQINFCLFIKFVM